MPRKAGGVERSPVVMVVAALIWLSGLTLVGFGVMHISVFGWWAALLLVSGLSSMALATATMVTGKPEWILLDLLLPN